MLLGGGGRALHSSSGTHVDGGGKGSAVFSAGFQDPLGFGIWLVQPERGAHSWEVFMGQSWKWCHYILWPLYAWEMWFICVPREEDMDLVNKEPAFAPKLTYLP